MGTVLQDLRYASRSLSRERASGILAIAALALGIGATTTMFSIVDATLWRSPPLPEARRIAVLHETRVKQHEGLVRMRWSVPVATVLQRSVTSFESMATFTGSSVAIDSGASASGLPEQVDAEIISADYFTVLRVSPASGRVFTADEDGVSAGQAVAIVGDTLARRYDSASPSAAVGATIRVNDVPLTIVGVMPPGFHGLSDKAQLWIPRTMAPLLTYSEYLTTPQHFVMVVARLKNGATFESANAELAAIAERFAEPDPFGEPATWGVTARTLGDARADDLARRSAYALLGAAVCVLLIACVNVASLLLARARVRQREIAIRFAIGSSRFAIVRQLLTEGLLISAAAGSAGIILSYWGVAFFARTAPAVIPSGRNDYSSLAAFATPSIDFRVLTFALVLTVTTTIAFALAPAIAAARPDLVPALKEADRATASRAFGSLVVAEVALAVLLLVSAGVLLESFQHFQRQRVGFNPDHVLTFWVRPSNSRYRPADGPAIIQRLLTRIEEVPGVVRAAVNRATPFYGGARTPVFFPDRPIAISNTPIVGRHYISKDYFRALGIPLLSGRMLTDADRPGTPPVTVISEATARRFWPGENPIGKRVWFGTTTGPFSDPSHAVEVVGVVGNVPYDGADQGITVDFYTSFLQFSYPDTIVVVKTAAEPAALVPSLRAAVVSVDPALPIYDVLTLDDRIDVQLARPRFNAAVVAIFAFAALALAAIGVYGVLSYSVSARSRELGIRIALGADAGRVVRLVLREGLTLALVGIAIGLTMSAATGQVLRGLLVGIATSDARLLVAGSIVMLGAATLAALVPARRAARVDPIVVLRE